MLMPKLGRRPDKRSGLLCTFQTASILFRTCAWSGQPGNHITAPLDLQSKCILLNFPSGLRKHLPWFVQLGSTISSFLPQVDVESHMVAHQHCS